MRKKVTLILAIFVVFALIATLQACNAKQRSDVPSDISRLTQSYLAGESDSFAVSVERGIREKQFIADGKVTDACPFTEIKIVPLKLSEAESINYTLSAGDATFSGTLNKSVHGEFKDTVTLDFAPERVTVTQGELSSEIDLSDVLAGAITPDDAIAIARDAFKDRLEAEAAEGRSREVYMKLITGDRTNYYYYVSFVGDGVNYLAILISPDGKVISKRS